MFTRMRHVAARAAGGLCFLAMVCSSGVAIAEMPASIMETPEMRPLITTPIMLKAIAALKRGDSRNAAIYFRQAAQGGNPMAQVALARLYHEGLGVPQSNAEAVRLLKGVVERNREPTRSLAIDELKDISMALRASSSDRDRLLGMKAGLAPLLSNPLFRQWSKNVEYNRAHTIYLPCIYC